MEYPDQQVFVVHVDGSVKVLAAYGLPWRKGAEQSPHTKEASSPPLLGRGAARVPREALLPQQAHLALPSHRLLHRTGPGSHTLREHADCLRTWGIFKFSKHCFGNVE